MINNKVGRNVNGAYFIFFYLENHFYAERPVSFSTDKQWEQNAYNGYTDTFLAPLAELLVQPVKI